MAMLYADEDFSYPVVQRLRQLGHDILTAYEAGQADQGITDAAVVAFATTDGRAVLTFNRRHFIRLHTEVRSHAGIISIVLPGYKARPFGGMGTVDIRLSRT